MSWDVNHPDTNGMIEYFIRPMGGIRSTLTRREVEEFRKVEGMGFRSVPAGVADGAIDEGTLSLGEDYRRTRACRMCCRNCYRGKLRLLLYSLAPPRSCP